MALGEQPEVEAWSAVADRSAGRVHIEWDTTAPVTPLGRRRGLENATIAFPARKIADLGRPHISLSTALKSLARSATFILSIQRRLPSASRFFPPGADRLAWRTNLDALFVGGKNLRGRKCTAASSTICSIAARTPRKPTPSCPSRCPFPPSAACTDQRDSPDIISRGDRAVDAARRREVGE
jgi:hypothetical protein